MLNCNRVAIAKGAAFYPARAPFHPPQLYPEFALAAQITDSHNGVYPMVREGLRLLGLDAAHFDSPSWNPLSELIHPGDTVLLKPNFVLDRNLGGGLPEAVTTHPSVLRAVADYVLLALQGRGKLIIGDAPQIDCRWDDLISQNGMDVLLAWLREHSRGVKVELIDFRNEQASLVHNVVWKRIPLREKTRAGIAVHLGSESAMDELDPARLYGADYDRRVTVAAHKAHLHEYVVAPEVLEANVVISLPKLKTHSKVGTTLNLKNMVGINVDKNHLPHFRVGSPKHGGDELPESGWDARLDRWCCDVLMSRPWRAKAGKYAYVGWRAVRSMLRRVGAVRTPKWAAGNWHGNDTAWRMAVDLNRVLLFADRDGRIHGSPQRRYLSVIDGVIAGEREGPLHPEAYSARAIICGCNPVAVDWIATQAMGFDPLRIPLYQNALEKMKEWLPLWDASKSEIRSNYVPWEQALSEGFAIFDFKPPRGWRGHIETDAKARDYESTGCAKP